MFDKLIARSDHYNKSLRTQSKKFFFNKTHCEKRNLCKSKICRFIISKDDTNDCINNHFERLDLQVKIYLSTEK